MNTTSNTLDLPNGASFTIVESSAESGGARIEFEVAMPPGAQGPPRHFHPQQHESWRVIDGELTLEIDGRERKLSSGEAQTIPPGTVHTFANRGATLVQFRDLHSPALDFQQYIETLARLATEDRINSRLSRRSLVYGAMVLKRHRTTQLTASRAQRAAESALAVVGGALGYQID
jgi:mannose-6-phosphate isomerase-like protein (cupin superfamily)